MLRQFSLIPHARERMWEKRITIAMVIDALQHGRVEINKTNKNRIIYLGENGVGVSINMNTNEIITVFLRG